MIIFSDNWNSSDRGLGVKMLLSTALIIGVLLAEAPKVNEAIGGPDPSPVFSWLDLLLRSGPIQNYQVCSLRPHQYWGSVSIMCGLYGLEVCSEVL